MAFAETEARRLGLAEISLYTNVVMTENLDFYAHLGFRQTHEVVEDGFHRVYMAKAVD